MATASKIDHGFDFSETDLIYGDDGSRTGCPIYVYKNPQDPSSQDVVFGKEGHYQHAYFGSGTLKELGSIPTYEEFGSRFLNQGNISNKVRDSKIQNTQFHNALFKATKSLEEKI